MIAVQNGRWTAVDAVSAPDVFETVYNFRVADYHTYFVGGPDWSFSVWAHNACRLTQQELDTFFDQTVRIRGERALEKRFLLDSGFTDSQVTRLRQEARARGIIEPAKRGPRTDPNAPHNAAIRAIVNEQKAKGLTHIGGHDLTEILIETPNGFKPFRRADASFRDPVTGELIHFNVGLKNKRGDPIIREREALIDVIQRAEPANRRIKFREYTP